MTVQDRTRLTGRLVFFSNPSGRREAALRNGFSPRTDAYFGAAGITETFG